MTTTEDLFIQDMLTSLDQRDSSSNYKSIQSQLFPNAVFKIGELEPLPSVFKRKSYLISETEDDVPFHLKFKYLNSNMESMIPNITKTHTILDIKHIIEKKLSIPVSNQRLLLKGRPLGDDKKMFELNIDSNSTVYLQKKNQQEGNSLIEGKESEKDKTVCEETKQKLLHVEFWTELEGFLKEKGIQEKDVDMVVNKWKLAAKSLY
ncbi:hypothetical protein K502DRAFT_324574 [Neoconidiobolus thromboides FSU 785]|nr:hypothetical protein K502DRAFT_324574 [Neoconidiobolus thromboides FSU 785]